MPVSNKVVRHSRHEMVYHDAEADGSIEAGMIVEEENGGNEITPADGDITRLLVAQDDRERGMILGDEYVDGENAKYIDPSGGGINVLMAEGETLDPEAESRVVLDESGYVRPFDDETDDADDVLLIAAEDETIEATDGVEAISVEVV